MRASNVSVVSKCSLVKGLFLETNLTTHARARTRAKRPLTATEQAKLLHRVERNQFIDRLRHEATKQGVFDRSMWHLDHPLPGTTAYLRPSDRGAGAEALYRAVEERPLWMKLWVRARLALKPRQRAVLDVLLIDWRTSRAARIAGENRKFVLRSKTFFKTHFAQCYQAFECDLRGVKMSHFWAKSR